MKTKTLHLVAGILVGIAISGPTAQAAETWLKALPSTQAFFVRGQQVTLEAYTIGGYNYVKLRDIGQAAGINVYYDAERNAAVIDPDSPYTGEKPTAPTVTANHSAQVNPAIFTGMLTKEVYNAIRDTVENREAILVGSKMPLTIPDADGRQDALDRVTAALGTYPAYGSVIPEYGKLACNIKYPTAYTEAAAHTQGFINGLAGLTDKEKAEQIAWYVCDHLTYSAKIALPSKALASDGVTAGNCMSYARSFQFLCDRAGLPCLLVHSTTHQWNKVYVEGKWWDVDVTSNDVGDDTRHRAYSAVLCGSTEMQGKDYINEAPEITAFAMEVLVPGSTK